MFFRLRARQINTAGDLTSGPRELSEKMPVAMKLNAPNPLNQFDRATVNRPPNAGAVRGLQGG